MTDIDNSKECSCHSDDECDCEGECDCDDECGGFPTLGEYAPDFEALSTMGPITLSDYLGKWIVLFSHPADFTPVCTSEIIAFSEAYEMFRAIDVQLIGLSVDSVSSHIAWLTDIKEKTGVSVQFPIIADTDMYVSAIYGMIHPELSTTTTVRAVFIIDDKGILRAMFYYPITNGRFIPEIARMVQAMQVTDKTGTRTPANWGHGDKVLLKGPDTVEEATKRAADGSEGPLYYLRYKKLE